LSANILVVEDEADINDLLSMNLRDMNHHVDSCHNGREGLEKAQSGNYCLITVVILRLPAESIREQSLHAPSRFIGQRQYPQWL